MTRGAIARLGLVLSVAIAASAAPGAHARAQAAGELAPPRRPAATPPGPVVPPAATVPVLLPPGPSAAAPARTVPATMAVPDSTPGARWPAPVLPRRRQNWALIAPGIAAVALGWLGGAGITSLWVSFERCGWSCTSSPTIDAALFMLAPVAGPWIALGANAFRGDSAAFGVVSGVLQPLGVVLILVGVATPSFEDADEPALSVGPEGLELAVRF